MPQRKIRPLFLMLIAALFATALIAACATQRNQGSAASPGPAPVEAFAAADKADDAPPPQAKPKADAKPESNGESDAEKQIKIPDPARFEDAIAKFEEQDKENPPAKGRILFVGSSSIRLWDLKKSFPEYDTLNRGFGGSVVHDSLHFADRIVLPYEPRTIVIYAGDNDIKAGLTPQQVLGHYVALAEKIHAKLPKTKIVYIAIKPSVARWNLIEQVGEANRLIREHTEKHENQAYVDIDTPMLGEDGKPRPELFVKDGLHLSAEGYALWTPLVKKHLGPPDRKPAETDAPATQQKPDDEKP